LYSRFFADIAVILSALLLTSYIRLQTPIRERGINSRPELGDYLGYIVILLFDNFSLEEFGGQEITNP
jgi:hypothetical protein